MEKKQDVRDAKKYCTNNTSHNTEWIPFNSMTPAQKKTFNEAPLEHAWVKYSDGRIRRWDDLDKSALSERCCIDFVMISKNMKP